MDFKYKNRETGDVKVLTLTETEMANLIDVDDLYDEFYKNQCSCQPIGETNVIECGCEELLEDFELQSS